MVFLLAPCKLLESWKYERLIVYDLLIYKLSVGDCIVLGYNFTYLIYLCCGCNYSIFAFDF